MKRSVRTETVTGAAMAQALLSVQGRRVLSAFAQPTTLSEAARTLNAPLNTVKYQLRKLVRLGLLQPLADLPGPGVRYVRSAPHYFVPYHLTSATWPQDVLDLLHREREAELGRSLAVATMELLAGHNLWGVEVVEQEGALQLAHAVQHAVDWNFTDPQAPAVLDLFRTLTLSQQDAKSLQADLLALLKRYRDR